MPRRQRTLSNAEKLLRRVIELGGSYQLTEEGWYKMQGKVFTHFSYCPQGCDFAYDGVGYVDKHGKRWETLREALRNA